MRCAVKGCGATNENKACKESFFSFPTSHSILQKWIKFCDEPEKKYVWRNAHICEKHFKPEDYENSLKYEMGFATRKLLKKGSIPSIKFRDYEAEELEKQRKYKKIIAEILEEQDSCTDTASSVSENVFDGLEENEIQYTETNDNEADVLVGIKPTETEHFMKRERYSISNATFCDELHQSISAQTELPNAKMCALLSITMDHTVYQINCFYCENKFFLQDWSLYVEHMQEHLKKFDDDNNEKNTDFEINYCDPLDFNDSRVVCKSELDDQEDFVSEVLDQSSKCIKRKMTNAVDKPAKVKKSSTDGCYELLNLETTEPKIILGVLDLLYSSFPMLWFIPPTNFVTYSNEIERFRQVLKENWMIDIPSAKGLKDCIRDILEWYIGIKENNEAIGVPKFQIDYFNKCAEFLPDKIDGSKNCNICEENFPDYLQYLLHKREAHSEMNEATNSEYLLDVKKMRYYIDARWHFRIRQMNTFECKLCNTVWKSKPTKGKKEIYFNHMKGHANLPEYVCDLCGKAFRRWNVFVIHRRRHTGIIKRECLICGKMCNSYWDLTCHRVRHHRPIEGTIEDIEKRKYGNKAKGTSKYRIFINPETKKKRFGCDYCSNDYSSYNALYKHHQDMHPAQWQSDKHKRQKNKKPMEIVEEYLEEEYLEV